jgi:hypothetical protein
VSGTEKLKVDNISVPPDLKTFAEFENLFFGEVRKIIPDTKCFIISNWAGDTTSVDMNAGLSISKGKLEEKLVEIDGVVRKNATSSYRGSKREEEERLRLFSCIGNDKMLQHFWETAAKNAGRPLKLLLNCFDKTVETLHKDATDCVDILDQYHTISIGEELEHFASTFVDNRLAFF